MTDNSPVIAGNWKMHKSPDETREFFNRFTDRSPASAGRRIWFFPPALCLAAALDSTGDRPELRFGVQNIHWEPAGAFTGEISAPMARSAGASLALVGHSERRHVFGETEEQTGRKVAAALAAGLHVVLCVGETLDQRNAGELEPVLSRQIAAGLLKVEDDAAGHIAVAYEPVWAIGTGVNATPEDAAAAHAWVRRCIGEKFGDGAAATTAILYGGSVKPDNAADLLAASDVDGVLVGGASLDPESFARIAAAGA